MDTKHLQRGSNYIAYNKSDQISVTFLNYLINNQHYYALSPDNLLKLKINADSFLNYFTLHAHDINALKKYIVNLKISKSIKKNFENEYTNFYFGSNSILSTLKKNHQLALVYNKQLPLKKLNSDVLINKNDIFTNQTPIQEPVLEYINANGERVYKVPTNWRSAKSIAKNLFNPRILNKPYISQIAISHAIGYEKNGYVARLLKALHFQRHLETISQKYNGKMVQKKQYRYSTDLDELHRAYRLYGLLSMEKADQLKMYIHNLKTKIFQESEEQRINTRRPKLVKNKDVNNNEELRKKVSEISSKLDQLAKEI